MTRCNRCKTKVYPDETEQLCVECGSCENSCCHCDEERELKIQELQAENRALKEALEKLTAIKNGKGMVKRFTRC